MLVGYDQAHAAFEQFGQPARLCTDYRNAERHGLDQRDGDTFVEVVSQIDAGQDNQAHATLTIHGGDIAVGKLSQEGNAIGQAEGPDLGFELSTQLTAAGHAKLAGDSPAPQQRDGLNEISMPLDGVQIGRAKNSIQGSGRRRHLGVGWDTDAQVHDDGVSRFGRRPARSTSANHCEK